MTLSRDEEIHIFQIRNLKPSQVEAVREMVAAFVQNNSRGYGDNVVNIWARAAWADC